MGRVTIANDDLHFAANALRRAISLLWFVRRAVNLLECGKVHIGTKSILNCFQIGFVAVRCKLHTSTDAASNILHEVVCPSAITTADHTGDAQLCEGINRCPSPNVAPA
jgi:hypothetical protein